jgi:hypothetical protein
MYLYKLNVTNNNTYLYSSFNILFIRKSKKKRPKTDNRTNTVSNRFPSLLAMIPIGYGWYLAVLLCFCGAVCSKLGLKKRHLLSMQCRLASEL